MIYRQRSRLGGLAPARPIIIVIYNYCCLIISFIYHLFIISVLCEILQSTENIIVNFTSTVMGSNATYQCRDGSSDVYTTQCTSDGVWKPNPNSVLYCRTPGIMNTCDSFTTCITISETLGSIVKEHA